uniref:Uncharacterized protein n=1 Tax=Ciona savignyi TaxID=51511 RepID=H2ZCU9_CIOSA
TIQPTIPFTVYFKVGFSKLYIIDSVLKYITFVSLNVSYLLYYHDDIGIQNHNKIYVHFNAPFVVTVFEFVLIQSMSLPYVCNIIKFTVTRKCMCALQYSYYFFPLCTCLPIVKTYKLSVRIFVVFAYWFCMK